MDGLLDHIILLKPYAHYPESRKGGVRWSPGVGGDDRSYEDPPFAQNAPVAISGKQDGTPAKAKSRSLARKEDSGAEGVPDSGLVMTT